MSETQLRFWHKRFKDGDLTTPTKDRARSGRPRSVRTQDNISKVKDLLAEDRRRSVRGLAAETELSESVIFNILRKDIGLKKKSAHVVPQVLTAGQMETRAQLCDENLHRWKADPDNFLSRIITCDETWLSTFEMETKRQSAVWLEPGQQRSTKGRSSGWAKKTMITLFFDEKGVVWVEFLPPRTTIKAETFIETLKRLKEVIRKKCPQLWAPSNGHKHSFLLHMDNTSPHTAGDTETKMKEWDIQIVAHPPYSPDLTPCDFSLFPKLKEKL